MKIVPRAEWKAAPPKRELVEAPISELEGIAVHWFGSPNAAKTHDRCAALIKSVQTTHMKEPRDYSDIAYNHLVCHHGFVFEGRGFGFVPGANGTRASNRSHAAVAYMVGWDDGPDIYSTKGLGNLAAIIQEWIKRGAGTDVRPHGYFVNTNCPGPTLGLWVVREEWKKPPVGVPHTTIELPLKQLQEWWQWLPWLLGEGAYKDFGPRNMAHRPATVRKRVPQEWWQKAVLFLAARK